MKESKISLIVPLHNVASYLSKTLESIAAQDFQDFEVILVEDGSTDDTASIARAWVEKHPNWQLIAQPQQGVSVARNMGTQHAQGEYVAYLDGDDWLMPHTLSVLYTATENGKVDMVQGGFYYAYENHVLYDNRRQSLHDAPKHFDTETALMALCQPYALLNNFLWCKLIRRAIALACPNPPGRVAQDAFVMHDIVARCREITILAQPLWFYRQRKTGLSGHFSIRRKDLLEAYEARIAFLQSTNRSHLLSVVMPEYARQITTHVAAAQRSGDAQTIEGFKDYYTYAKREYAVLWDKYAPGIWMSLKWRYSFLFRVLQRIGRMFSLDADTLLKMTYTEGKEAAIVCYNKCLSRKDSAIEKTDHTMSQKRILLAVHSLPLGGVATALTNMLSAMQERRFQIDLVITNAQNIHPNNLPKGVHILSIPERYESIALSAKQLFEKGWYLLAIGKWWGHIRYKLHVLLNRLLYNKREKEGISYYTFRLQYLSPFLPDINPSTVYDLAISYIAPHHIVRDRIRAKTKIAWMHTDYSILDIHLPSETKAWSGFNHIISISDEVGEAFGSTFPRLKDKLLKIENIILPEEIRRKAVGERPKDFRYFKDAIHLLTVGRADYPKNLESIAKRCRLLREQGLDVHWFIMAPGDVDYVRSSIQEEKMEDYVHVLGARENPYPYITHCDWYVQPSRFEGKAVAVQEAQVLCRPIIITNYPTAASQIQDGIDGVIVPLDIEASAKKMGEVLRDDALRERLIHHLQQTDMSNAHELEKLYALLPKDSE